MREAAVRVRAAVSRPSGDGRVRRRAPEPLLRGERKGRALQNRERTAGQLLAWRVARQIEGGTEAGDGRWGEAGCSRLRIEQVTEREPWKAVVGRDASACCCLSSCSPRAPRAANSAQRLSRSHRSKVRARCIIFG